MIKRADGLAELQKPVRLSTAPGTFGSVAADGGEKERQETGRTDKKDNIRRSVYIYIATLFIVVLMFTLLSYFVQQRYNTGISSLTQRNATSQLNIERLQDENLRLREDNGNDKKQLTELQEQVAALNKQLADLQQKSKDALQNLETQDKKTYDALQGKYNTLQEQYDALVKLNGAR